MLARWAGRLSRPSRSLWVAPLAAVIAAAGAAAAAVPAAAAMGSGSATGAAMGSATGTAIGSVTGSPAGGATGSTTGEGWNPSWLAEFGGGGLPAGCSAFSGWDAEGGLTWNPAAVVVTGGMLQLDARRTRAASAGEAGGIGCEGHRQVYGRYEIRAEVLPATGRPAASGTAAGDVAAWIGLRPARNGAGWTGVELPSSATAAAEISDGSPGGAAHQALAGPSGGFHVYVVESMPRWTRISRDGQVVYTGRAFSGARYPVISAGGTPPGGAAAVAAVPARVVVDYLRTWTYVPGPASGSAAVSGTGAARSSDAVREAAEGGSTVSAAEAPSGSWPGVTAGAAASGAADQDLAALALAGDVGTITALLPWILGALLIAVVAGAVRAYGRSPQRLAQRGVGAVDPSAPLPPRARAAEVAEPATLTACADHSAGAPTPPRPRRREG